MRHTVHENSVALTWIMTDRSGVSHYEIEYEISKIKTIIKTKDPSREFTITGLQSKTTYTIKVRAVLNSGETGKWSSSIDAKTGMLHQLEDEFRTQLLVLL